MLNNYRVQGKYNNNNIFSGSLWAQSFYKAIKRNSYIKPFVLNLRGKNSSPIYLVLRRKKKFPLINFLEYPAQEIAYDIRLIENSTAEFSILENAAKELLNNNEWHIINFRHYLDGDPFAKVLLDICEKRRISEDDDSVWSIELPGTFQEYLSSLKKEHRKKFSYYLRRIKQLQGFSFGFAVISDFEKYWEIFLSLHRERIKNKKQKSLFFNKLYKEFYYNLALAYAKKGSLKLSFLELDNQIVATLFGIEKEDTFYYLNSGFSLKASKYSLGIVLPLLCIEYAISNKLNYFNLLGGDSVYKQHLGAKPYPTKKVKIFRNSYIYILYLILRKLRLVEK